MSLFEYVMILPAIVVGLALTHLLSGAGRVVHRLAGYGEPIRLDWIHLTWIAHIVIWIVFFWWYSYAWTERSGFDLIVFVFLIFYTVMLYLMCVVLVPSDLDEVGDFSTYFMSLRGWFFAGVILLIVVDFVDTAVKGFDHVLELGVGYLSLRAFLLVGSVAAIRSETRAYQGGFALIAVVWTFLFFWLTRPTISG